MRRPTHLDRLETDAIHVMRESVAESERPALKADSNRGAHGDELDLALLVDGLAAEREQGITIDVAYRVFALHGRRFIVADTPGHEQYTRNMVTGASRADLAVILVDATRGLLTQTRRHSFVLSLLGVRQMVLAVNKLDAIGYDRAVFERIAREYREFATGIDITDVTCVPISALRGDNIATRSQNTPWYHGPTVLDALQNAELDSTAEARGPLRPSVQWINRPDPTFRDVCGPVAGGRPTGDTLGAGLVRGALGPARNLHWQDTDVNRAARSVGNGHQPCVIWLTGLSGAGKSTIGDRLERRLHNLGAHTYLLDGDNLRHGINQDLGFSEAHRVENIRRMAEIAGLMVDAGLIVIVACISPFRADRELARGVVGPGEFCEVFVDTPLAVAEQRDPKGLYRKARRGELPNFTGIDSPYQAPTDPDLLIDTTRHDPEQAVAVIVGWLRESGTLD